MNELLTENYWDAVAIITAFAIIAVGSYWLEQRGKIDD